MHGRRCLIAGLAWAAHGLLYGTPQIIWPYAVLALTSGCVLRQLATAHDLSILRTWPIPVLVSGLAFGADASLGPVLFAAVAFIPGAVGQTAQLRETLRITVPTGVSMLALLASLVNQLLWIAYAVPAREIAVLCEGIPMSVLVAMNVVTLRARRRQLTVAGELCVPEGLALTDVITAPEAVGELVRTVLLDATTGAATPVWVDAITDTEPVSATPTPGPLVAAPTCNFDGTPPSTRVFPPATTAPVT